ncbi:MAG: OsmC family protein [Propionibacteriaceae bacterium]|jgi:uncharacterized OsmC-like protein|nr:OsmC family protein [Propionibacteriaceae bacterium]
MTEKYVEVPDRIAPPEGAQWWVERIAEYTYVGHNARGSQVLLGPADAGLENSFSPVDLLKIALAACAGMSTNSVIARALGQTYAQTIAIDGETHSDEDRYRAFSEQMLLDTSELTPEQIEDLADAVKRGLKRFCTVSNTVEGDTTVTMDVKSSPRTTD